MTEEFRTVVYQRGFHVFMGVPLKVSPGVLIPRSETELLGRTALAQLAGISHPKIIDMCAGSGNLACALAMNCPEAQIWAADASPACVALMQANIESLALGNRVKAVESDLFHSLQGLIPGSGVDMIVCNPPYISSRRLDTQSQWLLDQEPREAFDGGPYGINILRRLVREAPLFLRENGKLCFEFGEGQHEIVERLLNSAGAYTGVRLIGENEVPRLALACKRVAVPGGRAMPGADRAS